MGRRLQVVDVIVSVYKTGGDYNLEYVKRLSESVVHTGLPFVCLSDDKGAAEYGEHIPLAHNWRGWWSKIELFKSLRSALYFDLDTVIKGDISELVKHSHKFTMLSDLNIKNSNPTSGVMAWNGDYSRIYSSFNPENMTRYDNRRPALGDQGYIAEYVVPERFQTIFPDMFTSYKWGTEDQKKKANVICYHGKPRPHETGWAI